MSLLRATRQFQPLFRRCLSTTVTCRSEKTITEEMPNYAETQLIPDTPAYRKMFKAQQEYNQKHNHNDHVWLMKANDKYLVIAAWVVFGLMLLDGLYTFVILFRGERKKYFIRPSRRT